MSRGRSYSESEDAYEKRLEQERREAAEKRAAERRAIIFTVIGALAFVIAIITTIYVATNIRRIEPGEIGMQVGYGNRDVKQLDFGFTFEGPTERIIQFKSGQQALKERAELDQAGNVTGGDAIKCQDRNGIPVWVDATTLWRLDRDEAEAQFRLRPSRTGMDEIEEDIVNRDVEKAITAACNEFTYYEIYGEDRPEFIQKAHDNLKFYLEDSEIGHLIVDDFIVTATHLEAKQRDALAAVDTARNEAAQARENIARAQAEAESKRAEAEGLADAAVTAAEGQAESRRITAEGEANQIRIIQEQLQQSPDYVEYLTVTQWNGQLPYVTGEGGSTLFQLPQPNE